MAINQSKITNNSNNKGLKFHWISTVNDNLTVNNVSFSQVGSDASQNYVANLGGFKDLLTADFALYEDGTDKSTDGDNIITLKQQRDYLKNTIIQGIGAGDSQGDVLYTLTMFISGTTEDTIGGIDGVQIRFSPQEANLLRGSITLIRGTN